MNEYLNEKSRATVTLAERASSIHEKFEFIFGNSRLDITLEFKSKLDEIRASASAITKPGASMDVWKIANHVGSIDDGFISLENLISKVDLANVQSSASHTFILTSIGDIDSFLQYHRLFMAEDTNEKIYSALSEKIADSSVSLAEDSYLKFPHSTILYARYLQHALNNVPEKDQMPYLLALERAKTRAIVDTGSKLGIQSNLEHKKKDILAWPLQRFGLVPAKQNMTSAELVKFYFENANITIGGKARDRGETKKDSLDVFMNSAKVKKLNILVISAITTSPIEYNVSTLLEPTPGVDASHGISLAVLKKFNTVHKYTEYDTKHPGFSVTEHKFAIHAPYIVIRTIDGIHWDAMKNATAQDNFVDSSLIENILRGPSPRADTYQKIRAAAFGKFIMPMEDPGEMIKKENKGLIQDLVNRITGRILQYVDTSLVPLPTDPKGLEAAISDPRFIEIMTEEFLASYKDCGIDATRPADEFIGTFISDFENNIAIQFARNIKLNMIELGPSAIVFRDYHGETLRTRLYNIFVDVIRRSITSSIMTKENIYEKILIKDHMLTVLSRQLSKAESG
jgi:hypothetical protein